MNRSVANPGSTIVPFPSVELRAALVTSDRVSAAALALADVAGLDWRDLSPQQMQRYRELALMAGLFGSDDDTATLVGYLVETQRRAGEHRDGGLAALAPVTRTGDVSRVVCAIRWAAEAVFGLHLDQLQAVRALKLQLLPQGHAAGRDGLPGRAHGHDLVSRMRAIHAAQDARRDGDRRAESRAAEFVGAVQAGGGAVVDGTGGLDVAQRMKAHRLRCKRPEC